LGTFGTGLLGSDSAVDFLDHMGALPPSDRVDQVTRVLSVVVDDPSSVFRTVVPEEVLAAAVLVAASRPGTSLDFGDAAANVDRAALPAPAPAAVGHLAGQALDVVTGPGSWWRTSWMDETDLAEATEALDRLRAALRMTPDGSQAT
jgi:alpha-glucosidase